MNEVILEMIEKDLDAGPPPESWQCVDCGSNTAPGLAH
jgi:hypothetical protein